MTKRIVGVMLLSVAIPGSCQQTKPDYTSLMKLVFPDLQPKSEGFVASKSVPVRSSLQDQSAEALEGDFQVGLADARPLQIAGQPYTALLLTTGADDLTEPLLLAVADLSGSAPRLIDVVDVRMDRFCGFWKDRPIALSRDTDGLVLFCTHHNSQEGYALYTFLGILGDHVVEITTVPLLSVQGVCGGSFEQSLDANTIPAGERFNRIELTVKVVTKPDDPALECKPPTKGSTRRYRAIFRWDAQKQQFTTTSKELEALASWNKERY